MFANNFSCIISFERLDDPFSIEGNTLLENNSKPLALWVGQQNFQVAQ